MPKAFYFVPSCLKDQLEHTIIDIQQEQEDHLIGERDFKWNDVARTLKLEDATSPGTPQDYNMCEDCHCGRYYCHKELFDEYCCDHVIQQFWLYPTAMTQKESIWLFVKKINSALHFWRYSKHCVLTKKTFEIPPCCLKQGMYRCADLVEKLIRCG